jgi:hypothetical protein
MVWFPAFLVACPVGRQAFERKWKVASNTQILPHNPTVAPEVKGYFAVVHKTLLTYVCPFVETT